MTKIHAIVSVNSPATVHDKLAQIALAHLDIETLEQRGRDALDFHEVSVWSLKDALMCAFEAGRSNAQADVAPPGQR